jgi:integrase
MAVVAEIGDIEIDIDDEAPRHAVLVLPLRLRGGTKIDLRQGADDSHPSARDRAAANAALPRECTACGLRKALQRLLSEHGASTKDLQAVSGHASITETERYTQAADQARLARAAIMRLPDEG